MGKILALLGGRIVAALGVLGGGWKTFIMVTVLGALSIVGYNLVCEVLGEVFGWAASKAGEFTSGGLSNRASLTGLAAYFAEHLRMVECFAVVVQVVFLKFMLRKIPFLRW